jgi:hypothetical protein
MLASLMAVLALLSGQVLPSLPLVRDASIDFLVRHPVSVRLRLDLSWLSAYYGCFLVATEVKISYPQMLPLLHHRIAIRIHHVEVNEEETREVY